MKIAKWIIITVLIIAAASWLSHFLFLYSCEEAFVVVISNSGVVLLAGSIGYLLISFLEKKETYNMFAAVLLPFMPVFALWLASACFMPELGYVLIALFPFLFIASSLGGILAHKKRLKNHA